MLSNKLYLKIKPHLAQIAGALILLLLVGAELILHPRIANIIENQINTQTKRLNINLEFDEVDYGYLPPNVSLKKVSFKDSKVVALADQVSLSISVLPLLKGQVKAGHLYLENLNASLKLPASQTSDLPNFNYELDEITKLIPIENVLLTDSKLILFQGKDVFDFDIDFLEFQKLFGKLQLEVKSNVSIRAQDYQDTFLLNSKIRWQEKGFFISFFTLQKKNSILQLSGFLKKQILNAKTLASSNFYKNITELRLSVNADLQEFNQLLLKFINSEILERSSVKKFTGRVQASGYYFPDSIDGFSNDKGSIKFKADDLRTPVVNLKEIDFSGEVGTSALKSEKFKVQLNTKSSISLENLILEKKDKAYFISVDLKSDLIRIEDVIESLNFPADSIQIPLAMDAHCGGSIHKNILVKCTGSGEVRSFDILNSKDGSKLVSTKNIETKFFTSIRKDGLDLDTTLSHTDAVSMLKASTQVNGSLDYVKGYNVTFESSPLNLSFINNISKLNFSGQTSLEGSAKGSSKWGTFKAKLKNKAFKLNDFYLGNSTAEIDYKYPLLNVKNIEGEILEYENSYSGDFSLDVDKNSIALDFLGQKISDHGLRVLFLDLFQLPADMNFQSNVIVKASGSTDVNLMNLDLKTKLTELNLFGEKFESGTIELAGKKGNWFIKKGSLFKTNSNVEARGSFDGLKTLDVRLVSDRMKFEDSTFIDGLGIELTGPFDLILNAKGPIDGPEAVGTLFATNTQGPNKNSLGNSNLGYRLFGDELYFKGDLINNSFNGEGFYPLNSKGKLSLKGSFKNFDILNFLNFNSENSKNTHLYLNGQTDFLRKKNGSFKGNLVAMNGTLSVDQRKLLEIVQTGNGDFKEPISFKTIQKDDEASVNFDLSTPNNQSLSFSGSLDISFLQPLIPTCEFISGKLKSDQLSWNRATNSIITSGTAKIESANFKSDAFPYSFSKIKTQLKTGGDKIYISELTAFLSNTKIFGSGQIKTTSPSYINLDLSYSDLKLEFPEKIFTTSDGDFRLSGSSIPLDISGKLLVKEGVFADELLSSSGSQTVMPNKRLPGKILRSSSPPADLKNVQVVIRDRMKVTNTEADGYLDGQLVANGNPADPTVRGKLRLTPGFKINFQDNTFNVKEGIIEYKNKTVDSPDIFVDASTVIKDNNDPLEKTYSVRMLANGSPAALDIDFTSQPALDDKQIVSLLTIGTVSTQSLGQEINAQEQAAYSGFQFGSYLLQRNKAVKDLKKNTGIELGVSSSLTSFGVSPKVEAKKGWTPKLSSSLSQTFGNQRNLEFKNEYKLNQKTSTILGIQNNQTNDATQLNNRRVRQGVILDLGLQYKFEFD